MSSSHPRGPKHRSPPGGESSWPYDRTRQLQDLVQEFTADLLFALSLGSKELFHSNLLGWLAERHRGVGDALLGLWDPERPVSAVGARREWQHLDLVLDELTASGDHGPTRVVVENKMFALPDLEQLRKYGSTVRQRLEGSPSLILLSLADPGWPRGTWTDDGGSVWQFCSYRSLASAVSATNLPPGTDHYTVATLDKWKDMLDRLDRLVELVGNPEPDEPFRLPNPIRELLVTARLDGPIQKLRAHYLADRLRRHLSDLDDVSVAAGLTNGVGFVEAFVPVGDGVQAGWQLQGAYWRMAIRVAKEHKLYGRGEAQVAARARLAERSGWARFDQTAFSDLPTKPTLKDGTPAYGRFSPDFVYRYVKVEKVTTQEAADAGAGIARQAFATRDAPRWHIPP